ncbi:MAG: hypothetical protein PHX61_07910 [Alphaproteobacteria bacterium]|nr:hypothetical protein [Alphaproteobacteria bacterium]
MSLFDDFSRDENLGDEAAAFFRTPDTTVAKKPVAKSPLTVASGEVFYLDTSYPDEVLLSGALPINIPVSAVRSKEDLPLPADFNPYTVWGQIGRSPA